MEGLEKERDFYFGKLRDIEVMCQECEGENSLIQKILDVLYATEVRVSIFLYFLSIFYMLSTNSVFLFFNYCFEVVSFIPWLYSSCNW